MDKVEAFLSDFFKLFWVFMEISAVIAIKWPVVSIPAAKDETKLSTISSVKASSPSFSCCLMSNSSRSSLLED